MNKLFVPAISALALYGLVQAHAESNGLAAVERPATPETIVSSPARADFGSEAYQGFAGPSVLVMSGQVLPSNGSEGIVQTANSLPPDFMVGTPEYAYAQSVQRYFAEARAEREMLAKAAHGPVLSAFAPRHRPIP